MKNRLKILELTNFSAGICGVWQRVKEESARLREKGYDVRVFSSNATKGNADIACESEILNNVKINRFPFKKLGGESFMNWNFEQEALDFSPDIIICHSYRHLHTTKALKIAEKLEKQGKNCKVFLVTHAPFERAESRSLLQKISVDFYDFFVGRKTLNKFDKIIAITKWEIPYLKKLGVQDSKIVYIPNGIPEQFFILKKQAKETNQILFLGRISPIKNIEVLIRAMPLIKNKSLKLVLAGPAEEDYKKKLREIIKELKLSDRIIFHKPVYEIQEKIKLIDSSKIFVLPSKSEGMPQSLIEAMARGKIVVGNDIPAIRDLIKDGKNGYIFKNIKEGLAEKINTAFRRDNSQIENNARDSVREFNWDRVINRIEGLFKSSF